MGTLENERIASCETTLDEHERKLTDHETRMRSVEITVWKAVGAGTFINALLIIAIAFYKH